MKNKFLIMSIVGLIALPACAELTNEQAASSDYLINHGHSSASTAAVEKVKAQANGVKYVDPNKKEYEGPVKWIRNVFIYFDPGLDSDTYMNHDTQFTPKIDDL